MGTPNMDRHSISQGGIHATVLAKGAELCAFGTGPHEMMWQAGPLWPRHAPVLFPIVGRLKDDALMYGGQNFHLTQHGFARDRVFAWAEREADHCCLVLVDDTDTRGIYPFAFRLELEFRIADGALIVTYRTTNTGEGTLPVSQGAHPAFRWPLADGVPKEAHRLTFEANETAPMPRVSGGLLGPATHPSPIHDRLLELNEALFADDALILPAPASRWLRYTAPGALGLEMRWNGFPSFGIWMRPGANFLCLEPWSGMASPADWTGSFEGKPGLTLLAPGEHLVSSYELRILEAE